MGAVDAVPKRPVPSAVPATAVSTASSMRVVLIDGHRLAALMFEHDVGVPQKRTYVVKDIDGDYFEES
jgi:restriction system protein